jgi:protein involved in polysaccharide export with SLBB domain
MRSVTIIAFLVGLTAIGGIHVSGTDQASAVGVGKPVEHYIYIHGSLRSPGRYNWFPGMTFQDAVQAAGGFTNYFKGRVEISHAGGIHVVHYYATTLDDDYNLHPPELRNWDFVFVSVSRRVF